MMEVANDGVNQLLSLLEGKYLRKGSHLLPLRTSLSMLVSYTAKDQPNELELSLNYLSNRISYLYEGGTWNLLGRWKTVVLVGITSECWYFADVTSNISEQV